MILRIDGATSSGAPFRLREGTCVIGSAESCDIVIYDRAVSLAHAEVSLVPGGVVIRDLGSGNGTIHLGQRVDTIFLAQGGSVLLGTSRLRVEVETETFEAPGFEGGYSIP